MEIDGEVNIEIDQYAPVNLEIDVGTLAEELCQSYDLVDDVRMREYVDERMDDYELRVQDCVNELHEQIGELSPDNNYVRINDLHATIREVVDASFVTLLAKLMNYMESTYFREQRNANQ
jgi:hypothetical protein